jgi:protein-disulfide isomerase
LTKPHILAALLLLAATIGCKGQPATQNEAALNHRIEVLIRSQYRLPAEVVVQLKPRIASDFSGYQTLPVVLTFGKKSQEITFLLSNDGKTLARLDKYDLQTAAIFNIDVQNRPIRGNPNAPVTVITFDDLECPYCARMHMQLFPQTMALYGDNVRFIYKDYPLAEIHPWAIHAAVDANCLAAQNSDSFWKYVDYVHAHPEEMSSEDHNVHYSFSALDRIARQMGTLAKMDEPALDACLTKQDETKVRKSMAEGEALNLEGAPAVFVNGQLINGAVPTDQVWSVIDSALTAAGIQPPAKPAAPANAPADGTGN